MFDDVITPNCPRCSQPNFESNCTFHYCGDDTKQCPICGKDWPSNICPKCYKKGYQKGLILVPRADDCPTCGKRMIQKIKLPYRCQLSEGGWCDIIGWCDEFPDRLSVRSWKKGAHGAMLDDYNFADIDRPQYQTLHPIATKELLTALNIQAEDIPGYRPIEERVVTMTLQANPHVQKVKLPYPYSYETKNSDTGVAYIEGWSEDYPDRLLVKLPTGFTGDNGQYDTLSKGDTYKLLNKLGFSHENIPGYKPTKSEIKQKKKAKKSASSELVEYVSMKEWQEFQRWKDAHNELEEVADENVSNLKELLRAIMIACPDCDDDMDDIIQGIRKVPRMLQYIKTGIDVPMDVDDEDAAYYYESHNMHWSPAQRHEEQKRGKLIVEVHIEDISDGKL